MRAWEITDGDVIELPVWDRKQAAFVGHKRTRYTVKTVLQRTNLVRVKTDQGDVWELPALMNVHGHRRTPRSDVDKAIEEAERALAER